MAQFRILLMVSVAFLVASALIPFDHPYKATFPIDRPPLAPLFFSLCLFLYFLILPITIYGLLRFRSWAPNLATLISLILIGLIITIFVPSDLSLAVAFAAKISALVGGVLWIAIVYCAKFSPLKSKFKSAL